MVTLLPKTMQAQTATFPRMDTKNWQHRQTTWVEIKLENRQPDGVEQTKQQMIMN
jgi:hypothetical protein